MRSRLSCGELPPFSERDNAVLLEDIAAFETAVPVEVVVVRGMSEAGSIWSAYSHERTLYLGYANMLSPIPELLPPTSCPLPVDVGRIVDTGIL